MVEHQAFDFSVINEDVYVFVFLGAKMDRNAC